MRPLHRGMPEDSRGGILSDDGPNDLLGEGGLSLRDLRECGSDPAGTDELSSGNSPSGEVLREVLDMALPSLLWPREDLREGSPTTLLGIEDVY